jgi:DHA1 family inner membrane transport protein
MGELIMPVTTSSEKEHRIERLVIPSLTFSRLNMTPPRNVAGLLLIEIGLTFGCSVGVMGQLRTLSSAMALIFAMIMGVLSVRYSHKKLLLTGLVFYAVSALGCFLSHDFNGMMLTYSLSGIGLAMVSPMAFALVGELLPLEKRSSATGWIFAGTALSSVIQFQLIGYIEAVGGWRLVFIGFVFPLAAASLILAYFGIPPPPLEPSASESDFLEGFREVLSNRSAIACLLGTMLSWASYQAILTYGVSFYKQYFLMTTNQASLLFSGLGICYVIGNLSSGRYVDRFGRKAFTFIGYLTLGSTIILLTNIPYLWLSVTLALVCLVFVGLGDSASNSLILEQVPMYRGTMMSTWSAATSLGATLGAGLGGMLLLQYDYSVLGFVLGGLGVLSALIYRVITIDPLRT